MATTEAEKLGRVTKKSVAGFKLAAASTGGVKISVPTMAQQKSIVKMNATAQAARQTKMQAKTHTHTHLIDSYVASHGDESLDAFVTQFARATPYARIDAERSGVGGALVKALAKSMGMANVRMFEVIGIPKATAEKKAATNMPIAGAAGQSALGMVRLLGIAKEIVGNSDAAEARNFDTAKWLGRWIERPQPSLGGRKPADVLDTPTGVDTVVKLLGALESGVYL